MSEDEVELPVFSESAVPFPCGALSRCSILGRAKSRVIHSFSVQGMTSTRLSAGVEVPTY